MLCYKCKNFIEIEVKEKDSFKPFNDFMSECNKTSLLNANYDDELEVIKCSQFERKDEC